MTSLTIAGSLLLQGLAGDPLDMAGAPAPGCRAEGTLRQRSNPVITTAALAALARIHDRTRRALACEAVLVGSRQQGE